MYYKDQFFVVFNCVTIFGQIYNRGNVSVFLTVQHKKGYLVPTTSLTTFLPDFPVHLSIWFGRSSKDVLSENEKRKRTASTCSWQDWKTRGIFFSFLGGQGVCDNMCIYLCVFIWMVRYTDGEQVVKSSQGVLSAVPQLQAEEKHLPTCPQLHRPIHHCSFNTFSQQNIDVQINLLFLKKNLNLTLKQRALYLPVVSQCILGIVWPARRAAREVFPTPVLPEMKIL